ncbi:RNA polymerase sigma factor [Actinomadura roseirufa]|uniref:RNA polymerase sigma factor n=1 Tax=Actinomadura roseirufa TaxID=2094049 RepID=UPI00104119D5|nr:RNA polymerase sigma factor [Actinomadura roseirufa]
MAAAPPRSQAASSTDVDDASLIERSRSEPELFAAIFDRHAGRLRGYVARRLGPDAADDVVADTFLIAFRRRTRYDLSRRNAAPWLYGIATNLIGERRRAEVRMYRAYARSGTDPLIAEGHAQRVADAVSAEAESPRLAAALASLTKRDRDALLLFTWGDLSYEEVARALDVPVGTVRSRLHRARRKLRAALGTPTTSED